MGTAAPLLSLGLNVNHVLGFEDVDTHTLTHTHTPCFKGSDFACCLCFHCFWVFFCISENADQRLWVQPVVVGTADSQLLPQKGTPSAACTTHPFFSGPERIWQASKRR